MVAEDVARDEESWGQAAARAVSEASGFMAGQRFPQMRQPIGFGTDYDFPTSPAQLSALLLGELQLQITGYHTHLLRVLGEEAAELGALETAYDIALGLARQRIQDARGVGKGSRVLKDNLTAMAIEANPKLTIATKVLMGKRATMVRLEAQREIYQEHLTKLSREQSRREMEARIGS